VMVFEFVGAELVYAESRKAPPGQRVLTRSFSSQPNVATAKSTHSSKSFSGPRFPRKKYAAAPITIEKNPAAPAINVNPPQSTRAPGTPANFADHTGAYPKAT
jgi:hypothetical protein